MQNDLTDEERTMSEISNELIEYLDKKFQRIFDIFDKHSDKQEASNLKINTLETKIVELEKNKEECDVFEKDYITFKADTKRIIKIFGGILIILIVAVAGAIAKKAIGA